VNEFEWKIFIINVIDKIEKEIIFYFNNMIFIIYFTIINKNKKHLINYA